MTLDRFFRLSCTGLLLGGLLAQPGLSAPKPTAKAKSAAAAEPAPAAQTAPAPSPTTPGATASAESVKAAPGTPAGDKKKADGEIEDVNIKGQYKGQLQVGKLDPPAAFNLEDIQNFPEERLHPVLNNPVNFEEGRDFSAMMDFEEEKMVHPWLPDFPSAPYLSMNGSNVDTAAKDWTFSIIDQNAGAVWTQQGKGNPPPDLSWNGEDKERGYVAVDTVYIPQISITNKEGYHRTYPGQPAQFSAIRYSSKGQNVIELSSKALFQDKKSQFTKEGELLLEKVTDIIREEGKVPFAIRPYDNDLELARTRQQALAKYLKDKLYVADSQIIQTDIMNPEKRGNAIAIVLNATPGGSN